MEKMVRGSVEYGSVRLAVVFSGIL